MTFLAIVCGMEAEAAALGRWRADPRVAVVVTGGRPDRAEAEAGRLASGGARALLSWGIAGGLDPALAPGALLVPEGVIVPGGRPFAFDPALVAACRTAAAAGAELPPAGAAGPADQGTRRAAPPAPRAVPAPVSGRPGASDAGRPGAGLVPAASGPAATAQPAPRGLAGAVLLAGSDAVLFTAAEKAALRRRAGAAAVDMETHRIAAAARGAGVPCLAVRAVSDTARRRLPALAAYALDTEGRPRTGAVMAGLARRPWDLGALIAAGRDSRAALATLRAAADTLVPALLSALSDLSAR